MRGDVGGKRVLRGSLIFLDSELNVNNLKIVIYIYHRKDVIWQKSYIKLAESIDEVFKFIDEILMIY